MLTALGVGGLAVALALQVAYESHLPTVEELTLKVARETAACVEGAVKDFEPLVRFYDFSQSGVKFRLIMRISDFPLQHDLRHELVKRLHAAYQQAGIVIPYPTRTLHQAAGQKTPLDQVINKTAT